MTITSEQKEFVENEILSRTLRGAFQRVRIYDKVSRYSNRDDFRKTVRWSLKKCSMPYRTQKVSSREHIENIERLRADLGVISFGVAQKLLNLYLKCLWCAGYLYDAPPHCPVDSIILKKIELPAPRWPLLEKEDYEARIKVIEEFALQENVGVAQWELRFFNSANPTYDRKEKSVVVNVQKMDDKESFFEEVARTRIQGNLKN